MEKAVIMVWFTELFWHSPTAMEKITKMCEEPQTMGPGETQYLDCSQSHTFNLTTENKIILQCAKEDVQTIS
jgi:hypothetical protein